MANGKAYEMDVNASRIDIDLNIELVQRTGIN